MGSVAQSFPAAETDYRLLGDSSIRVSVPIVGCGNIGDPKRSDYVLGPEKALPLLKATYDRGLTTWETTGFHCNGYSERVIAQAIKEYNLPRHKLVLMAKMRDCVDEGEKMEVNSNHPIGLSRSAIFTAVNDYLARLETDYIGLFWICRFDPYTPIEETMRALHDLVTAGEIRCIGASLISTYQVATMQSCAETNGWTKFVAMQERELNKFRNETGVAIWGLIPAGHIARSLSLEDTTGINSRVEELARRKGWTLKEVAMAWTLQHVTNLIWVCYSAESIDDTLSARGKELRGEEIKYLEEPYTPSEIEGHHEKTVVDLTGNCRCNCHTVN
ncbi:hypothetical protein BDW71DRAFT_200562 [Aspergillus fruticulosus]